MKHLPWFSKPHQSAHTPMTSPYTSWNRMFDDFFRSGWDFPTLNGGGDRTFQPTFEIKQKDDEILVKAELPGMTREDVHIELDHDTLTVRGEKKLESKKDDDALHYSECRYGYFERRFQLPYEVDRERAVADLKDGVLKVELKKSGEQTSRTRKIEVR